MIAGLLTGLFLEEGCNHISSEVSVGEYVYWIESGENGLHPSKTIAGYTFDLQFKPSEYVVIREYLSEPANAAELLKQTDSISDMQYFTLRISKEGDQDLLSDDVDSKEEFSSRLVYFTGVMQQDISLIENGDTLPCCLFHFERTFSVDPRSTFLLGFPLSGSKNPDGNGKVFLYNDRELGTGPIMLSIEQKNIENIPSLKFN